MIIDKNNILIGKTIKIIRKEKIITTEILAEKCNYNEKYINRIERGINNPTFKTFISICNSLEIKMSDFALKMNSANYIYKNNHSIDTTLLENKFKYIKLYLSVFLIEVRKEKNLTQIELAKQSNINKTYYGIIERGKANPTINIIIKICNTLNITFYELLQYIENQYDKTIQTTYTKIGDKHE